MVCGVSLFPLLPLFGGRLCGKDFLRSSPMLAAWFLRLLAVRALGGAWVYSGSRKFAFPQRIAILWDGWGTPRLWFILRARLLWLLQPLRDTLLIRANSLNGLCAGTRTRKRACPLVRWLGLNR